MRILVPMNNNINMMTTMLSSSSMSNINKSSLSSLSLSLFVYGTLMAPEVIQTLIGRLPPSQIAYLQNYVRYPVRQQVYPGLIPITSIEKAPPPQQQTTTSPIIITNTNTTTTITTATTTKGILYYNLQPNEMKILDWFEGDEYQRMDVNVKVLVVEDNHKEKETSTMNDNNDDDDDTNNDNDDDNNQQIQKQQQQRQQHTSPLTATGATPILSASSKSSMSSSMSSLSSYYNYKTQVYVWSNPIDKLKIITPPSGCTTTPEADSTTSRGSTTTTNAPRTKYSNNDKNDNNSNIDDMFWSYERFRKENLNWYLTNTVRPCKKELEDQIK